MLSKKTEKSAAHPFQLYLWKTSLGLEFLVHLKQRKKWNKIWKLHEEIYYMLFVLLVFQWNVIIFFIWCIHLYFEGLIVVVLHEISLNDISIMFALPLHSSHLLVVFSLAYKKHGLPSCAVRTIRILWWLSYEKCTKT